MKKKLIYIFLSLFFFCCFLPQVGALNWNDNNGAKNCNNDPFSNTSGQKRIPSTNNFSASPSGTTACEFHGYYSGAWSSWRNLGSDETGNHYPCPDQGYASQIEYNGSNTQYRVYCKYRDDTPPDPDTDILSYIPNIHNRLATIAETFRLNMSDGGGSPITLVQGYFEREDSNNTYFLVNSDNDQDPGNTSVLRINDWDIQSVDNDSSADNGKRIYKVFLSYIEDEAGNSVGTLNDNNPSNALIDYDYLVVANTLNIGTNISTTDLDQNSNIADGTERNINISLRDIYGNKIIPVSDVSRELDFEFNIDNYMRRNQYDNTGTDSGLYIDTTSNAVQIGAGQIESFGNRASTSGDYYFPFYVFAPSYHNNSLVPGNAQVNTGSIDIRGTIGENTGISIGGLNNLEIKSQPLFTSEFIGSIADGGFSEGVIQTGALNVVKGSTAAVVNPSLRVEFGTGSSNMINPDYSLRIDNIPVADILVVAEGHQGSWSNTSRISNTLTDTTFESFMTQKPNPVSPVNQSYLASILRYQINIGGTNRNIVYPGDVIGKTSYWGNIDSEGQTFQTGIRVTGNTTSDKTQEIIAGQFNSDIRILGKLTKSTFRRDIEQRIYKIIRYITPKASGPLTLLGTDLDDDDWSATKFSTGNTGSRGTAIFGNRALYFGNLGGANVEIAATSDIEGAKTIIVENGNLYISGNIENSDGNGILGIIVLNGNIYIDPTVTDIHAVLYTNQSLISYDGINELDGNNTSESDLANQLYIYGALFSENTIGKSRALTPECPYYVTACTSAEDAQKYDLNYIRRYYIYDSDGDGTVEYDNNEDSAANGGTYSIGGGNAGTGFRQYPVIIDYNSNIQQDPPPFF